MNHRNRTIAILASLTLVGTVYGCSSSSSSGDDSSATPDGGAGTGSDGGGGGGGSSDGGGGGKEYAGSVTANPQLGFALFGKAFGSSSCITTLGSCKFYNCPIDDDAGDVPAYGAGDITISGGKLTTPFVMHYDADAGSYGGPFPSAAFAAGDTLSVSAVGGDVSSFSGNTGPGPGPISLTAPTGTGTPGFLDYTIDTTKDLSVAWTGGTSGTQVAFSLTSDDDNSHRELYCTFDAAAGTGAVPAATLAQLGNPTSGTLQVYPYSAMMVSGSNVSVNLQLTNDGIEGSWKKP